MRGSYKRLLTFFAIIGLIGAVALNVWSFTQSDQKWKQIYISLAQAGEVQSRAYKVQEKLSQIRGHLQLAVKTGEDSPRLQILIVALKTDIQEILTAKYLDQFLSVQEIIDLNQDRQMLEAKYIVIDKTVISYEDMLGDISVIKQHVFSILGSTTARAQILGENVQIETQTAKYRFWFAFGFLVFLIAGIALYLAFFLQDKKRGTSAPSLPSSLI